VRKPAPDSVIAPRKVYFYEHGYLRDRQLDTARQWPRHEVLNPGRFEYRYGTQVTRHRALVHALRPGWMQRLPVANVKLRPRGLDDGAIVYTWGALVATGPFIVDLDNPYALTGYNLRAMLLYRRLLRRALGSRRCVEVRCLSAACRATVRVLFGDQIHEKATVHYPRVHPTDRVENVELASDLACRFLFVATQFEIKGGAALVRAFTRVHHEMPAARLDVIAHVPPGYLDLVAGCRGITVHEARFTREEIGQRFLRHADVLVHPTYVESFGMIVLEALAHGLAVVATDVYALREMVRDGLNGMLLEPPVSIWDGYVPSRQYYKLSQMPEIVRRTDTTAFESQLADAMLQLARNPTQRSRAKAASLKLFATEFATPEALPVLRS
jgi:glycosyltransferase involved in cell wall biosynthesis